MIIDREAKKLASLISDIDNQRRRYVITEGGVRAHFVSPDIKLYSDYYYYLLRNCRYVVLDRKYHYRPDYLSFDVYQTTVYWTLLLYINNVLSLEEFDIAKVLIPEYSSILQVTKNAKKYSKEIDLDTFENDIKSTFNFRLYESKSKPIIDTPQSLNVDGVQSDMPSYVRQKFVLSDLDIQNKYIDLGFTPIKETVTVKLYGQNIVLNFDEHYTIIENLDNESRRLSWNEDDMSMGSGMNDILVVNDKLDVTYAKL